MCYLITSTKRTVGIFILGFTISESQAMLSARVFESTGKAFRTVIKPRASTQAAIRIVRNLGHSRAAFSSIPAEEWDEIMDRLKNNCVHTSEMYDARVEPKPHRSLGVVARGIEDAIDGIKNLDLKGLSGSVSTSMQKTRLDEHYSLWRWRMQELTKEYGEGFKNIPGFTSDEVDKLITTDNNITAVYHKVRTDIIENARRK